MEKRGRRVEQSRQQSAMATRESQGLDEGEQSCQLALRCETHSSVLLSLQVDVERHATATHYPARARVCDARRTEPCADVESCFLQMHRAYLVGCCRTQPVCRGRNDEELVEAANKVQNQLESFERQVDLIVVVDERVEASCGWNDRRNYRRGSCDQHGCRHVCECECISGH